MYISVKQAAEKWGVSDRKVRMLCEKGKIAGAKRGGGSGKSRQKRRNLSKACLKISTERKKNWIPGAL